MSQVIVHITDWEENYGEHLRSLLEKVKTWDPDYIVPVGRKCGKLFRSVQLPVDFIRRVFYRQYFDFMQVPVRGKKVAVVDDSVTYCSALRDYRDYFEQKGAVVRTFALVGHGGMKDGTHISYDPSVEVEVWLSKPSYEDYVFAQAQYLLVQGFYHDVHHLVLEIELGESPKSAHESLFSLLSRKGYTYFVRPYLPEATRFSTFEPSFFLRYSQLHPQAGFFGGINKIRFHVSKSGRLTCVPMVVPRLDNTKACPIGAGKPPFTLPCQYVHKGPHFPDNLCYWSISLLLSAELGRAFFQFLRREYPILTGATETLKVADVDFMRYLGISVGQKLAEDIGNFLKRNEYAPDENLLQSFCQVLLPRSRGAEGGSFSESGISTVVEHLRNGYEERARLAGTRVGVHYSLGLDQIQTIANLHILPLLESLDSYCDLGILVPALDEKSQPLERHWRSGEPQLVWAWTRTEMILPIAIKTATEELNENKVGSLLVMKMLANFAYDYHERFEAFNRLHCLKREPHIYGSYVTAYNPVKKQIVTIYDPKEFRGLYTYGGEVTDANSDKGFFSANGRLLEPESLAEAFEKRARVSLDQIIAYFSFMANLKRRLEGDVLTALSICRTPNMFLTHVIENLNIWLDSYGVFLKEFKELPYSENTGDGVVHRSGESVNSGLDKITMWHEFPQTMQKIKREMNEMRFAVPLTTVEDNTDMSSKRDLPILGEIEKLLKIQRALTGLTIAKVMPEMATREPIKMIEWADGEFKTCKFDFDTIALSKADHPDVIRKILEAAYYKVFERVQGLPKPIDEGMELERKAFRAKAINQGVAKIRQRCWQHPAFVQLDLTGFRAAGKLAEKYVQELYRIATLHAENFGGECITENPGGNDFLVFAFYDVMPALRMAAASQLAYKKNGIRVKIGVERAEAITTGEEYDVVIRTMGTAKDLCEYKNEPHYRNVDDILVASTLVDYLDGSGVLARTYFELVDKRALGKDGLRGTEVDVYRLLHERFLADNR